MTVPDPEPRAPGPPGLAGSGGDHRSATVFEAVRAHRAADEREWLSRSIILTELERLDRPLDESAALTHVTASAIVVGCRGVVLHRHRRLLRWLQPGGHVETGELPPEAARRECVEETGLPVTHPASGPILAHVDVHTAARDHIHLDLRYLLWAPDLPPAPGPGESQEVAWFTWEAALEIADDALTGGLIAARRLARASTTGDADRQVHEGEDP